MSIGKWLRDWWARNIVGDNPMDDDQKRWQARLEREQRNAYPPPDE